MLILNTNFALSVDLDALIGGEVGGLEFGKLPFGACEDPIRYELCNQTFISYSFEQLPLQCEEGIIQTCPSFLTELLF